MFELWAKKRPIDGYGQKYEWIRNFASESEKYYMCDTLDKNIYEECMVIENNRLIFYKEFPIYKPVVKKKVR